jgi:antitoxin component of RelBE/YafQ-DinJ toxin-antitoxin module
VEEKRGRIDMRADSKLERQLAWLARRFNVTKSAIVRMAVARWAREEGMPENGDQASGGRAGEPR